MTVGQTEMLSVRERSELDQLEQVITAGLNTFVEVGNALMKIRDGKLHRESHDTFEDYCRERWGFTRMRASQLIAAAEVVQNVNHGLHAPPESERQARPLARLEPEQQREAWRRAVETAPDGKITAAHVESAVRELLKTCDVCGKVWAADLPRCPYCNLSVEERIDGLQQAQKTERLAVHFTSDSPEWYTPTEIIDLVSKAMGGVDLDPCSNTGKPNVPAERHYTSKDNGLNKEWRGRVYMNPPYGREIVEWVQKLVDEYKAGRTKEAIALVPARTDTEWFRLLREFPRCFVWGRLSFSGHENSAPFPSVLVYLGKRAPRFAATFADIGDTYLLLS